MKWVKFLQGNTFFLKNHSGGSKVVEIYLSRRVTLLIKMGAKEARFDAIKELQKENLESKDT